MHDSDDADHAAHLVRSTALAEGIASLHSKPVLHGDNVATLKATTVLAMLHWWASSPRTPGRVSATTTANAESLFCKAIYRPEFPAQGFVDLGAARAWAAAFVGWYNVEHDNYLDRRRSRAGRVATNGR